MIKNNSMYKKYHTLAILMGVPIFFVPECLNLFFFCVNENQRFGFKILIGVPVLIVILVITLKVKLTKKNLILVASYIIIYTLAIFKGSIYQSILHVSLLPFLLSALERRIKGDLSKYYSLFLMSSQIAAASSVLSYIFAGGDQAEASLYIYGYLNYWNDYIIILWLLSMITYAESAKCNERLPQSFFVTFLLVWTAVMLSASRASLIFLFFVSIGYVRLVQFRVGHWLLLLMAIFFASFLNYRLIDKIVDLWGQDPSSGRFEIWSEHLVEIWDWPILGFGDVDISSLHSTYVDIFYIYGVFSLFPLVVIFMHVVKVYKLWGVDIRSLALVGFLLGPFAFNLPLRQIHLLIAFSIYAIYSYKNNFK